MGKFGRYLAIRSLYSILILWGVTLVVFGVTQILPGDPATMVLGPYVSEQGIELVNERLGLNKPLPVQYFDWITGIFVGDWGLSFQYEQPVYDIVVPRMLRTAQLALVAFLLVVCIGVPLGVVAAIYRGSYVDTVVSAVTYVWLAVPGYVFGILFILLLGGPVFYLFPSSGYVAPSESISGWFGHILLPSVTLALMMVAHVLRQTRSELIDTLQSEYVRTARLKGLDERTVLVKHALRNGIIPTVTLLALKLGSLLGGTVLIEYVFSYPGIGTLTVEAIHNRDLPVLQMSILLIAAAYVIANLIADVLYTYLDPRIEYGGA